MLEHFLIVSSLIGTSDLVIMLVWQAKVLFLVEWRTRIANEALRAITNDLVMRSTLAYSNYSLTRFAIDNAIVVSIYG